MANSLLTPSVIAKEALMQLENNLVMGALVHKEYKREFVKIGDTVTIRKPVKFQAQDGATAVIQDATEGSTSITVDQRKHVAWNFSSQELTLNIEQYSERYIQPAMIELAQAVESSLMGLYSSVWTLRGTPGTPPGTFAALGLAGQVMDEMAVPNPRNAALTPAAHWALADSIKGLNIPAKAKTALEQGMIGNIAGLDCYKAQSIVNHTNGARGGTPLVNGASQVSTYATVKATNSQSLVTDGWSISVTGVVKKGDVFTLAGVYAVNPRTRQNTGALQNFVVNADANSDGSGNATLSISPAIITSGAYQTVAAAPADNAALTFVSGTAATAYPQNLAFHKNAFALVTVPLEMPDGAVFKARESHNGLSVRLIKDYDITNDKEIARLDIFYGVRAIFPELAARLTG